MNNLSFRINDHKNPLIRRSGADHIVFGADMPLGDHYFGLRSYRQTIKSIEDMQITPEEKRKIFVDNALILLRIPV